MASAQRLCALFVVFGVAGSSTSVLAGGGPENVLLVVNPRSPASLSIANHYIQLRRIPPNNLFFLPWDPKADTTDVGTFRQQILVPILRAIEERKLADQIDYVIYSCDFPWGINVDSDLQKPSELLLREGAAIKAASESTPDGKPDQKPPDKSDLLQPYTNVASINGLTYLWQPVVVESPNYLSMHSNSYMRHPSDQAGDAPASGFRGNRQYNQRGEVVATGGRRYFLSMMLGVTAGRGNTLDEVLYYLKRSARADGTHPKGTIYFVQNDDIRSKVRQELFPAAVRALRRLGVAAEILQGTVPLNKGDVQGVMMGTAGFDWKASGSNILPGAICEHFTSFGGVMTPSSVQTPLSEFLRYGAAGSSGSVTEPYAIPFKFPTAMLQVYYARGCTLAEAFYQSVYAPYQLLIVGDPLCRPWANIPRVSTAGIAPEAVVRGSLTLQPSATLVGDAAVDHFELFADGFRMAACQPGESLPLDTTRFADGYHELRVVAVGPKPIESQGREILFIQVNNHDRKIVASLVTQPPLHADRPLIITARSPGSKAILVFHGINVVGQISGEAGQVEIPANILGAGPVRLGVAGLGDGGPTTCVMATPLDITLQESRGRKAAP